MLRNLVLFGICRLAVAVRNRPVLAIGDTVAVELSHVCRCDIKRIRGLKKEGSWRRLHDYVATSSRFRVRRPWGATGGFGNSTRVGACAFRRKRSGDQKVFQPHWQSTTKQPRGIVKGGRVLDRLNGDGKLLSYTSPASTAKRKEEKPTPTITQSVQDASV